MSGPYPSASPPFVDSKTLKNVARSFREHKAYVDGLEAGSRRTYLSIQPREDVEDRECALEELDPNNPFMWMGSRFERRRRTTGRKLNKDKQVSKSK